MISSREKKEKERKTVLVQGNGSQIHVYIIRVTRRTF